MENLNELKAKKTKVSKKKETSGSKCGSERRRIYQSSKKLAEPAEHILIRAKISKKKEKKKTDRIKTK